MKCNIMIYTLYIFFLTVVCATYSMENNFPPEHLQKQVSGNNIVGSATEFHSLHSSQTYSFNEASRMQSQTVQPQRVLPPGYGQGDPLLRPPVPFGHPPIHPHHARMMHNYMLQQQQRQRFLQEQRELQQQRELLQQERENLANIQAFLQQERQQKQGNDVRNQPLELEYDFFSNISTSESLFVGIDGWSDVRFNFPRETIDGGDATLDWVGKLVGSKDPEAVLRPVDTESSPETASGKTLSLASSSDQSVRVSPVVPAAIVVASRSRSSSNSGLQSDLQSVPQEPETQKSDVKVSEVLTYAAVGKEGEKSLTILHDQMMEEYYKKLPAGYPKKGGSGDSCPVLQFKTNSMFGVRFNIVMKVLEAIRQDPNFFQEAIDPLLTMDAATLKDKTTSSNPYQPFKKIFAAKEIKIKNNHIRVSGNAGSNDLSLLATIVSGFIYPGGRICSVDDIENTLQKATVGVCESRQRFTISYDPVKDSIRDRQSNSKTVS